MNQTEPRDDDPPAEIDSSVSQDARRMMMLLKLPSMIDQMMHSIEARRSPTRSSKKTSEGPEDDNKSL